MTDTNSKLRGLPSVDQLLGRMDATIPHAVVVAAARRALDVARERIRRGGPVPTLEDLARDVEVLLSEAATAELQRVLNATGVLIHTNLGRVPLSREQLENAMGLATGYTNLEYDLLSGKRGSRYAHATAALRALTGAEAALVVNNNAAAVLLVLASLCSGRGVIISRGELIEIGGEFRIPDVMDASGARLVEVGTTNRTHLSDYEKAIDPETAAILKVHPSNYRVVGFTASVEARDLARIARERGIPFIHDLGSGLIETPSGAEWSRPETPVETALSDGADVVTFSGDKLFGGPQAGIIVGRADLIEKISKHPLLRAVRVDKLTLGVLDTTLKIYLGGRSSELPLWKTASLPFEELHARATAIAAELTDRIPGFKIEAIVCSSVPGGGSVPGATIASAGISLSHPERSVAEIERALRFARPPVIARIEDDRLVLDLRTIDPR